MGAIGVAGGGVLEFVGAAFEQAAGLVAGTAIVASRRFGETLVAQIGDLITGLTGGDDGGLHHGVGDAFRVVAVPAVPVVRLDVERVPVHGGEIRGILSFEPPLPHGNACLGERCERVIQSRCLRGVGDGDATDGALGGHGDVLAGMTCLPCVGEHFPRLGVAWCITGISAGEHIRYGPCFQQALVTERGYRFGAGEHGVNDLFESLIEFSPMLELPG